MAPRRVAPGRNPLRQVPARQEQSCQEALARKKLPGRSLLQHVATMLLLPRVKTPRCSQLQRMGTCKTRLSVT